MRQTQLSALLLELTPPTTLERFQDARTYQPLLLDSDGPSDHMVTIKYPRTVRGDINMSFGATDCRPSPVVVSFVPVETHLGLDTPRYTTLSEVGTAIVNKKHVDTHSYSISGIPEGTYDVYLEDANLVDNSERPECAVAPQSIRSLEIFSEEGASKYVRTITQAQARTLRVVVPGSSPFTGWEVDVVHPVTRERLSSRAVLPAGEQDAPVSVELRVSRVMGKDIVGDNQELLRLSPPPSLSAPTVTMVLAGLEVFEPGEALVPALGRLPEPVDYQAWVWRSPNGGKVDGSVQFTATSLDAIPAGINTTFERRATIGESGLLEVQLPPGKYVARVVPSPSSNLAQLETEVTVWLPPGDSGMGTVQGGHVIVVSQASTLTGQVRFERRVPPNGTQVIASGIGRWPSLWQSHSRSLPGSRALVSGDEFALTGLTCRECEAEGSGGVYNLFVRPSELSGIPWAVSVGERVTGAQVTVPEITLEMPRVVSGSLWAQSTAGPVGLARFSVRAFALIGKDGEPLHAVELPRCNQLPPAEVEALPNCAAQVLEVASTRTNDDGSYRLLLPQRLLTRAFADAGL